MSVLNKMRPTDFDPRTIFTMDPGDGREKQNIRANNTQLKTHAAVEDMAEDLGYKLIRLHPKSDSRVGGHSLIQEHYQAIEAHAKLPEWAKVLYIFDQWAFIGRFIEGTWNHKGPKAAACVYDGKAPGNVGALAWLAAALMHKYENGAYPPYLMFSSENFSKRDAPVRRWFKEWAGSGHVKSQPSQVSQDFRPHEHSKKYHRAMEAGKLLADSYNTPRLWQAYGQGCMDMEHSQRTREQMLMSGIQLAEIDQGYLHQRALQVSPEVGQGIIDQLVTWGATIEIDNSKPKEKLTTKAVTQTGQLTQALAEIAWERKAQGITIANQVWMNEYGIASSDGSETILSSLHRPKLYHTKTSEEMFPGIPIKTENERDIGIVIMSEYFETSAKFLGWQPRDCIPISHDIRHGQQLTEKVAFWKNGQAIKGGIDSFTIDLNLSGPTPVEGSDAGYKGRSKPWKHITFTRHDWEYFPNSGMCAKMWGRESELVYGREAIIAGERCLFLGRGATIGLTREKMEEIHNTVSNNWPLYLSVMYGRSRDEYNLYSFANHTTTMFAKTAKDANELMMTVAILAHHRGYKVVLCGDYNIENSIEQRIRRGEPITGPYKRKAA